MGGATAPQATAPPAAPRAKERTSRPVDVAPVAPSSPPIAAAVPGVTDTPSVALQRAGAGDPPGGSGGPTDFDRGEPPASAWVPAAVLAGRSTYMDYLPGVFSRNDFLARYLLIFETINEPVQRTVDNVPDLFDPSLAPADFLPWLGSWLGLVLDERWPDAQRRELIRAAADLYRWRGTRRGLSEYIRVYTGITPEIVEPTLSEVSTSRDLAFRFTVRLTLPPGAQVDRALLEQIIDAEKPAFAAGTLEIVRSRPHRA
jgi:phage tail-like protein